MNVVLASASERRHELLKRIISDFSIITSSFDENSVPYKGNCQEYVIELALGKARNVASSLQGHNLVIGCDTVVYHEGKVLGKPRNSEDAYAMLKSLSGKVHKVYSGLVVVDTVSNCVNTKPVCTEVFFSKLTEEQITNYIESGEPMDKAGAYGIQGKGGIFVEKIHGCYYNVVGLPLNTLYNMLREMGVNL